MALLSPQAINSTAIKKTTNKFYTNLLTYIQVLRKTVGGTLTVGRLDCYQVLSLDNTLALKAPLRWLLRLVLRQGFRVLRSNAHTQYLCLCPRKGSPNSNIWTTFDLDDSCLLLASSRSVGQVHSATQRQTSVES